ncbi:hypothetical protein [Mycolicibacterium fortuitum]|uniref:hypothetical protein n=1 Tax=Mycolicibacterium fortuitum TaxID=1766 RepID=UPI003AAF380A
MKVAPALTAEQITELLRRAGLNPDHWDLPEIVRKTNAWIADYHAELTDPEVKTWSRQGQSEHYDEFGSLAAVDFIEQCVIEAGPDTAPWTDLAARAEAGEFEAWPPVWQAQRPAHLRRE